MASIMKRGDSYSVRYKYKDHSGKPCEGWESFKTRKEAQERKITVEKELLDGTFLVPDTITVEEMLYKWIPIQSTKHKWSPKTYTQSVAMVQNLIVPYIGNRKVQELRTYDIEKFYATLAKTPCGQYVHGVKQNLSDKQKKRLLSSTSIHEVHTLLKTAFSYAVEWDLIHKIPLPRDAPKVNIEERTIWDEKTMLAALQTIENPALHLAVHMSMILSLREGEILGLQPSDLDFDAADGRGTISVNKTMQRANKDALEKLDPKQVYYTFPDRREGSKSSLILKKPKTKKSNRILYMTKPLKEELQAWLEKLKQDEQSAPEKYSNCGQLFRLPDGLPIAPELRALAHETDEITEHLSKDDFQANVCLNYGGRDEILRAVRRFAAECAEGKRKPEDLDETLFSTYLDSAGIPDPELIIRPSGEQRLSNFLLWQCAYSEFYYTDTLWPDFDEEELDKAIAAYQSRDRRFGGVKK